MAREYRTKAVTFVGVFVQDTEARAREFLRAHPVSFPVGYDWDLAIARALGFRGMPYTVILSPRGTIARRIHGPVTRDDLISAIESLL